MGVFSCNAAVAQIVVLAGLLLSMAVGSQAQCDFLETCLGRATVITGTRITSICKSESGEWKPTSLDLNTGIGNENGWFKLGGKNFGDSCSDIKLIDRRVLSATCKPTEFSGPNLDLNNVLTNDNGKLKFCYCPTAALTLHHNATLRGTL